MEHIHGSSTVCYILFCKCYNFIGNIYINVCNFFKHIKSKIYYVMVKVKHVLFFQN